MPRQRNILLNIKKFISLTQAKTYICLGRSTGLTSSYFAPSQFIKSVVYCISSVLRLLGQQKIYAFFPVMHLKDDLVLYFHYTLVFKKYNPYVSLDPNPPFLSFLRGLSSCVIPYFMKMP